MDTTLEIIKGGREHVHKIQNTTDFVYEKRAEWMLKTGSKIPYVQQIAEYVRGFLPEISDDEFAALGSLVFFANERAQKEAKLAYREKMIGEGWLLLTVEVFDAAHKNGQRLELAGQVSFDWLSAAVTGIHKTAIDAKGNKFLMPPRCSRRGHSLRALTEYGMKDCFCKIA